VDYTIHMMMIFHRISLFCGRLSICHNKASCNFKPFQRVSRDRSGGTYGIANFTFRPHDLSDVQISELEEYYKVDYCVFGIQPRVNSALCSSNVVV